MWGVLAREARLRTGPTGQVAGLDPSVGMLAVAKELSPSVDWRQGRGESIPFSDASFDAVVCQFGLMFMDRERAIQEMLRVLQPNGRLVVAVWDSVHNIPAYAAEIALVERLAGTSTPKGVARFPSIRAMVGGRLRGWLPVMGVHLAEEEVGRILEEAEDVLDAYRTDDGRVTFDAPAHLVTADKPQREPFRGFPRLRGLSQAANAHLLC